MPIPQDFKVRAKLDWMLLFYFSAAINIFLGVMFYYGSC